MILAIRLDRLTLIAAVLLLLSAIGFGVAVGGVTARFVGPPVIAGGLTIHGVDVGGLTREEAQERLERIYSARVGLPVELEILGEEILLHPKDLGFTLDIPKAVQTAYAVGREGNFFHRTSERLQVARKGRVIPLPAQWSTTQWSAKVQEWQNMINRSPEDARLEIQGTNVVVIPDRPGRELRVEGLWEEIYAAILGPDRRVRLQVARTPAQVGAEELEALGIRSSMVRFETTFGPDPDRIHNLRLASSAMDGVIILPGERFSFNGVVGPRVQESGFREAPIIVNGELVPGVGGGICQVSSTLYNGVLLAGLPVVSRLNHSLPVSYLPKGRDATVVWGLIDLVFANDRDHALWIRAGVSGSRVYVEIFGQKTGNEPVEIQTSIDREIPPEVQRIIDPRLSPGERRVDRQGSPGYHVSVHRVWPDGSQELVSRDIYHAVPTILRVGP